MCKFCEWGIELLSTNCDITLNDSTIAQYNHDVFISVDKCLVLSGSDIRNTTEIDSDRVNINYCPMCGKSLREE